MEALHEAASNWSFDLLEAGAVPKPLRLMVQVSPGELFDRITILQIKAERITEPVKLANVERDLERVRQDFAHILNEPNAALGGLRISLKAMNRTGWDLEEVIRAYEAAGQFGDRFVQVARSIHRNNDQRARLKRQIDELLGSEITEEKSFL